MTLACNLTNLHVKKCEELPGHCHLTVTPPYITTHILILPGKVL